MIHSCTKGPPISYGGRDTNISYLVPIKKNCAPEYVCVCVCVLYCSGEEQFQ